jgi:hypothetical protein
MKKIILIILWTVQFVQSSYSQSSKLNGTVINEFETGIPFAVVVNKTTGRGVLCDSLGRFNIDAKIGDSLSGSSVGYFTKNYILKSSKDSYKLILFTKADTLKEVKIVVNQNSSKQRVGVQKGAKIIKNSYFLPAESFLHAVCFNSQDLKFKKIYSLNIKMGYKGSGKHLPVRINLYSQSNKGFPGAKLGNKNMIVNVTKFKWYEITFEDEFTIPENGICIGFEPLSSSTETKKFSKENTPILGVYKSDKYDSFSLTNYTRWYKFNKGQKTCPAIYIEVY